MLILKLFFLVFTSSVSCFRTRSYSSPSQISYTDHCSSFVPEPTQNWVTHSVQSPICYTQHNGYYITKTSPPSSKSLAFQVTHVYTTGVQSIFSVEASLVLESEYFRYRSRYYSPSPSNPNRNNTFSTLRVSSSTLSLRGFWSEPSGKMCLVGGVRPYRRDDLFAFPISLKLFNLRNSTNLTNLVTGILESLLSSDQDNPYYFTPISLVLFIKSDYEYTLASQLLLRKTVFADESLGLALDWFAIFSRAFELKYSERCANSSFAKQCNPLGDSVDHLPGAVQLSKIAISSGKSFKMRNLMKFLKSPKDVWDHETFDPNTTLVGEGIWDQDKNRLFVVACQFLNATESWREASIGKCSTRLGLRFPAVWSIRHTSSVVGLIWSEESEENSGYFNEISFQSSVSASLGSLGIKYEYTEVEKAKKWFAENRPNKSKRNVYPEVFSYDMRFDLFGQSEEREISRGYAKPLTVGNQYFDNLWHRRHYSKWYPDSAESPAENVKHLTTFNASYEIGLTLSPRLSLVNKSVESWDISAEGIYDTLTGRLCLVGCRDLGPNKFGLRLKNSAFDCEILIRFQFPPRYGLKNSGFIRGIIESKRRKTDTLYFAPFEVASAAFVTSEARKTIWKADFEIVMGIISNTLSCFFVAFQLLHLRRNPDVALLVSLAMLLTLAFGYTTSLVMNLKSMMVSTLKTQALLLESGGWVEAKGVTQGISGLILIVLQARLLQRVWHVRFSESTDQTGPCIAEKEVVFVSLPLYFGAAFFSIFFAWRTKKLDPIVISSELLTNYSENPVLVALKSCTDILSDGFLVPQVLFNMFIDSRQKALAFPFYVGMTLVRVLPHVYGLYKAQSSVLKLVSVFWDVIVCLVSLLLAVIVFLQQKFGGRCVLPFRLKKSNAYEKVSSVAESNET